MWVEVGGAVGAHSRTDGGVEWATNTPIKTSSVKGKLPKGLDVNLRVLAGKHTPV